MLHKKMIKKYISQKVIKQTQNNTWLKCKAEFTDGSFGEFTELYNDKVITHINGSQTIERVLVKVI